MWFESARNITVLFEGVVWVRRTEFEDAMEARVSSDTRIVVNRESIQVSKTLFMFKKQSYDPPLTGDPPCPRCYTWRRRNARKQYSSQSKQDNRVDPRSRFYREL